MSRFGFGFGFNKPDYFLTLPFRYGAVAHWDFTDFSKLIEGATSTDVEGWKDSTTNAYDLSQPTASEQPTFTQPNGPVVFDGPNDYLEADPISLVDTATLVIKLNSDGSAISSFRRIISNKDGYLKPYGFHIAELQNDSQGLHIRGSGPTQFNPTIDTWKDRDSIIAVVFAGTTCSVYLDGVYQTSGTIEPLALSSQPIHFGGSDDVPNFKGKIYATQIYNQALNATQIANLTAELNS